MAIVSPGGEHSVEPTLTRIDEAGGRLAATAAALSEESLREPSLLPGWTRAHVLAHLVGNADGLRNLLIWAQTGVRTPQYASSAERDSQIEERSTLPRDELIAEIARSAAAFRDTARDLPDGAWTAEVRGLNGPPHPAWFTLRRRLAEIEIHHVDLDAGYGPADWPPEFIDEMLYQVAGRLAGDPHAPAAIATDSGTGRQFLLAPDRPAELVITGPGHALLAWLLGRGGGDGLAADPPGPLPPVPAY